MLIVEQTLRNGAENGTEINHGPPALLLMNLPLDNFKIGIIWIALDIVKSIH